jgi:hypothetical protein
VGLKAVGIILGNRKVARGKQPIIIQQKYKANGKSPCLLQRMSPLMAQSGHPSRAYQCPLLGVGLTWPFQATG